MAMENKTCEFDIEYNLLSTEDFAKLKEKYCRYA